MIISNYIIIRFLERVPGNLIFTMIWMYGGFICISYPSISNSPCMDCLCDGPVNMAILNTKQAQYMDRDMHV